jgi:F-type H+-transporting ATPase subunit alpha
LPFSKQILIIFAGTSGFLDDLPVDQVGAFESELYKYVDATNPGLLHAIMEKKVLDDDLKKQMTAVVRESKQLFVESRQEVGVK